MRRLPVFILPLLAAFALIAADCNGNDTPTPTPSSGIAGLVTIGPICPVVHVDTPCPDKPYVATIVISDQDGKTVTTVQSGVDGTFRVALAPGTYTLHPQTSSTGAYPIAQDQTIDVGEGAYSNVSIPFDSGIR